jgi:hypothetical protein
MGGAKEDTSGGSGDHRTSNKKDGMVKKNPIKKIVESGGLVLNLIKNNPLSKHTEKVNRNFFDTKVKKAGHSKYDTYEDYIRARGRGEVDAYGREVTNSGGNNNNQTVLATNTEATKQVASSGVVTNNGVIAPTNAEVTQAQSTDMSADQILVANKKKGRSQTILNKAQGLGSSTANTTKKTLGA